MIPHQPLQEQLREADEALGRLLMRTDEPLDPDVRIVLVGFSAVLQELVKYKWAPSKEA